jgi:hypothetical protein
MNDRIKELVKQSGGHISMRNLASNPVQHIESIELWDDKIEKFAELLVLECVNAVMDGTKEGDHYAMRIEQHFDNGRGGILHFGVEE